MRGKSTRTIVCAVCETSFEAPTSSRSTKRYCSIACRSTARKTSVTKTCARCGAHFVVKKSRAEDRHHCSVKCQFPHRIHRVCKNCNTPFDIAPSALKRTSKGKYCSYDCFREFRRRGRQPIPVGNGTALVPLTRGKVAIIDGADVAIVAPFVWCAVQGKQTWYASTNGAVESQMHRLLLNPPEGMMADHIDGDGLNNRRSNLRLATSQQNATNKAVSRNSKTGFKGVVRRVQNGNEFWTAEIEYAAIKYHLGVYSSPEDAARAYDRKAIELHGEFARLNFVGENEQVA